VVGPCDAWLLARALETSLRASITGFDDELEELMLMEVESESFEMLIEADPVSAEILMLPLGEDWEELPGLEFDEVLESALEWLLGAESGATLEELLGLELEIEYAALEGLLGAELGAALEEMFGVEFEDGLLSPIDAPFKNASTILAAALPESFPELELPGGTE
jgi:hypothetical protein